MSVHKLSLAQTLNFDLFVYANQPSMTIETTTTTHFHASQIQIVPAYISLFHLRQGWVGLG